MIFFIGNENCNKLFLWIFLVICYESSIIVIFIDFYRSFYEE